MHTRIDEEQVTETVTVPMWALKFILDNGDFQDDGPSEEGWPSPKMERALDAIDSALSSGSGFVGTSPCAKEMERKFKKAQKVTLFKWYRSL